MFRLFTQSLVALLLCTLAVFAQAEQKQQVGDWEVHYSAFNSTFLTPEIATQYNITRSEERGVLNISILDTSTKTALKAQPTGFVSNPRGGVQTLEFKEVVEGEAVYYLASFLFGDGEIMRFTINFPGSKNADESLTFTQKFYEE